MKKLERIGAMNGTICWQLEHGPVSFLTSKIAHLRHLKQIKLRSVEVRKNGYITAEILLDNQKLTKTRRQA